MAVSTENANLVWQKVKAALMNASPAAQAAFAGLKQYLATQGGNPDLQFIPFSAADIVVDTGYSPIGAACKVYGLYAKNSGAGDGTDSFIALHNAADNASAGFVGGVIQDDNDAFLAIKHNGWSFATDLTISAATAMAGATESAAANAADGFVIIGAA